MAAGRRSKRSEGERAFFEALRELYLRAGEPSSRSVAVAIGGMSHTTVNSALRGTRLPTWPVAAKLVTHFGGDVDQFRPLWVEARETPREDIAAQRTEVSVFVSYARIDDEATYGHVTQLVDDIAKSYRSITGKAVGVFKDMDSIAPGDDWKDRIRLGLSSSSIFLAFVSPAYLRSPNCREELSEFVAFLDANSSARLIIPLLYANADRIETNFSDDELWRRISRLQWIDVSKLRSIDKGSSEWIQKTEVIAERIDDILTEFGTSEVPGGGGKASAEVEEEPEVYILERMQELDENVPEMLGRIERFQTIMVQLGEAVEEAVPKMAKADTFAKKLAVSRALAHELTPIADDLASSAESIVADFRSFDFLIGYIVQFAQGGENSSNPEIINTVRGIWDMAKEGSHALLPIELLKQSVSQGIGFSRDLDRPLKTVQRACLKIADLRGMLNGWMDELLALKDIYPDIFGD